jgi:hypothetical protein
MSENVYLIRVFRGDEVINGTYCSSLGRARHDGRILVRCFEATRFEVEHTSMQKARDILRGIAMKTSEAARA